MHALLQYSDCHVAWPIVHSIQNQTVVENIYKGQGQVVTLHKSFVYLTESYGILRNLTKCYGKKLLKSFIATLLKNAKSYGEFPVTESFRKFPEKHTVLIRFSCFLVVCLFCIRVYRFEFQLSIFSFYLTSQICGTSFTISAMHGELVSTCSG